MEEVPRELRKYALVDMILHQGAIQRQGWVPWTSSHHTISQTLHALLCLTRGAPGAHAGVWWPILPWYKALTVVLDIG